MRKVIIMFALAMGIATANAQENVTVETTKGSEQPTLTKEVYPQKEADGDLYHGLTRKLGLDYGIYCCETHSGLRCESTACFEVIWN